MIIYENDTEYQNYLDNQDRLDNRGDYYTELRVLEGNTELEMGMDEKSS